MHRIRETLSRLGWNGWTLVAGVAVHAATRLALATSGDYRGGCVFECEHAWPSYLGPSLVVTLLLAMMAIVFGLLDVAARRTNAGVWTIVAAVALIALVATTALGI